MRKKGKGESYCEFGHVIEGLYRKALPGNPEFIQDQKVFLDNCNDSSNLRILVKRTFPRNMQEAITIAMQRERVRLTKRDARPKELQVHPIGVSYSKGVKRDRSNRDICQRRDSLYKEQ